MLKKKTKIIILSAMVVLLGITGYLNISLNNQVIDTGANTNTGSYSYFDYYRTDRSATRDTEILYYNAIISSETATDEAKANAETLKLSLIAQMEKELSLEYLIKGLGFDDAIITTSANYINVIVKSDALVSAEVAQIVAVVTEQTEYGLASIKIIPVV